MRKTERHNKKRNRFSIIFPILTIIGIGILFVFSSFYEKSWSYNWTGIREQIKDSVKVAEYGGISDGLVGELPKKPNQYDRRFWIMENATETELLKLTQYPNGAIKTIAYEGLIRKKDFDGKSELIIKAINDTEYSIGFRSGCTATAMYIGEYLIDFVLYIDDKSPPAPIGMENQFRISEIEREKILKEYRNFPSLWKT